MKMKMKTKMKALNTAIALVLGGASLNAQAALTTGATLDFVDGYADCAISGTYPDNCLYGVTNVYGSWFMMDSNGDSTIQPTEKVSITALTGIEMGVVNPIVDTWQYFGSTGNHYMDIPPVVTNDDVNGDGGFTKYLDWSGWTVTWNSVPDIPMGSGSWTGNPESTAVIICNTASCSDSSTFVLDYSGTVPECGCGFTGVQYALHLEGTVSAVPVPAAAWLFGSGLLGMIGVMRKKIR